MPDTNIVREGVAVAHFLAGLGRAVEHRELGVVFKRRDRDPDERGSGRIPRVDVVGERRSVLVHEGDVAG